ncbi:mitogen-activated protein kinase kinase kinase 4-like isoform X2 [Mercenaria mercenaria]|uniref:mitogen-activated protein kinase kinase kinase 4-like isoform X2 n=1 Tax=Mercenaria mercenaria TaxID=6596 RepID=UPI001E1E005F|nr:mitogen-activated protein kinase kinase kinase 4-like isoform X2 [Mercenaria mercenaria]
MADKDLKKISSSPAEQFNPLEEELQFYDAVSAQTSDHDADMSHSDDNTTEHDGDQGTNSLEGFLEEYCEAAAEQIPFTPPSSSRLTKREKIRNNSGKKQQSFKDFKASLAMDKVKKPKTVVGVIKERYTESNALLSGLHYTDSDADLERDNTREGKEKRRKEQNEKMKNITKSRQHETFMKRHSEDISGMSEYSTSMGINTPVVPLKLEGSGRFLSLSSGITSKSLLLSPSSSDRGGERRQIASAKLECPKDRQMFYKTFSALINMGSHGKKKEQKEKDTRMLAQRQQSSDEKLYMNFVWIGLQAWLNGLSPNEQEKIMNLEREQIPGILQEVMEFKVLLTPSSMNNSVNQGNSVSGSSSDAMNRDSACSVDTCLTDISETYHSLSLSGEIISQQQEAVIQVQKLLERLDKCEQLFPTSHSFASEFAQYKDPKFVLRLETLNLWLNTTKDLCHKMNVLGQVLNSSSVPDSSWPFVDFNSPRGSESFVSGLHRQSIPEIVQGERESEGEFESDLDEESENNESDVNQSNGNEAKKVSFQFSEPKKGHISPHSPLTSPVRGPSPNTFGSPPVSSTPLKGPLSSTSLSRASSEASLDELAKASIYRTYVDKGLKKMGLNKMLIRLRDILYRSLRRARQSLEQQHGDAESSAKSPGSDEYYNHTAVSPSLELLDNKIVYKPMEVITPAQLQAWRDEFLEIGLPSYRPTYIFLLQVLLEVIHEAMKIRLEQLQNPIGEPSFLSIRQLIIECKDVLAKAVLVKQDYQCMIQAVLDDKEVNDESSPLDLEHFDNDMSNMFKMYFQYLQSWLYHLQNLPDASRTLKNPLEEEWSFTKKICPHIIGGEAEAGKRFSTMAISLLNSISDFLESGVDECTTNLFDWTTNDISDSEEGDGDSDDDHDTSQRRSKSTNSLRTSFQKTCRNFKNLFHEARERASKALGFAKLLRKDLEIAADFNVAVPIAEFLLKLKESDHINVIAPLSAGYLMFIPARIADHRRQIIQLLNVTCGREDVSVSSDMSNRDDGYLLMVRCGGGLDQSAECPLWNGQSIQVEPTAETAIGLSHIQVESLLLVVIHSSQLGNQRKEFEQLMGNTVELVNEQTSCHQVIAESLIELKESAISLRDKVATVIRQVEEHWNCDMEMEESEKNHILKLYRETMLQAYNFGFEYMKEVTRLVSGETRHKLGRGLMHFAKDWMKFVSEKCERGRGMRPRWANQGLDFLLIACEPKILAVLSEEEYKDLQESLNEFITHLIGNAEKAQYGGPLPMRGSSAAGGENYIMRQQYSRYPSWPAPHFEGKIPRSQSSKSVQESPTSPQSAPAASYSRNKKRSSDTNLEVDLHDGEDGGIVMEVHRRHRGSEGALCSSHNVFSYKPHTRIVTAINKIEEERNKRLREQRVVGCVTKHKEVSYHINTRKVNFHWQKGNKIGEGQFGKVYSAVNMDNGELMAMKEMKFPSADMQYHFKEIIHEIKIFEGINHPNLVRYYGVEVHRTEMLVFMEYCDRGTIDEVSRVGLTEDLIRIYTKELLKAVQVLHDNGIVHRDIKGANIFLTSSGCLKLGDFGCSVKLKNHTTMVGEVNSLVGTTAYMAPEVITRNDKEGHGRAADIWSVGCVVIEMASGKRPWHELESNYQIMFKLGMGETPPAPENLGAEGKDFLSHCLEQEPDKRWTASQLRDHPFAKIYDPEGDAEDTNNSQS